MLVFKVTHIKNIEYLIKRTKKKGEKEMFGIDVSQYQGEVNWEKIKDKIDFAIIRLGWIGNEKNHTIDTQFERNYTECKRIGIPIGLYVYNYCNNEETVQDGANWVIKNLQGKSLELPIYIDMENDLLEKQGKIILTKICIAFNTIIENSGFWAGVYANKNWYENYLNKDEIKRRYTTWIATYSDKTDLYKGEYDMWQNSSQGKIEGIEGNVDTNYMYRNLISDIGNKNDKPNKSIEELANEVINGKYGNGEERKQKLGDLYSDVQAKVNEIINSQKSITYVVKKGDTLSGIAKKYNKDYKEIARKNNIENPDKIYVGMVLKI